jgi:uncharacterized protein YndB with AHSA1/START domain
MPKVTRQQHVAAGAEQIWQAISDVAAMTSWYPSAKRAETIDGPDEGVGRIQRVKFRREGRTGTVDAEVVAWEPGRRIAWRQLREFAGSKQSPLLARDFTTEVHIDEQPDGTCVVSCSSSWVPVGIKGELATNTVLTPKAELVAHGLLSEAERAAAADGADDVDADCA